jgi:soluble lytic murein transglycosylase-like protein
MRKKEWGAAASCLTILAVIALTTPAVAGEPNHDTTFVRAADMSAAKKRKSVRFTRTRHREAEFAPLSPVERFFKFTASNAQADDVAVTRRRAVPASPRVLRAASPAPASEFRSREVRAATLHIDEPSLAPRRTAAPLGRSAYDAMVARHAAAHGVPESLVHRVIMRESRYRPSAVSKGNYGIMQIRLQTARAMGYRGNAQGLLDADTNMTYAVKYLAGAYRAARGNPDGAIRKYASGYR